MTEEEEEGKRQKRKKQKGKMITPRVQGKLLNLKARESEGKVKGR
jgi:hypothetical protein